MACGLSVNTVNIKKGLQNIIDNLMGCDVTQSSLKYQLKEDGWCAVDEWNKLILLQKNNEHIIYNPESDEIVRRFFYENREKW